MKKLIVLILIACISELVVAQERNYLLHTNKNIERLKQQIRKNSEVKQAWEQQLKRSNDLLKKKKLAAQDCQELGLAYRMTGNKKYAEAIKGILVDYATRTTWEDRGLLNRTPAWTGGLHTSHTSFYLAIGYDCAYDYLSASERQKIAEGIVRAGITPLKDNWLDPEKSFHTFDTMGHNWWSACVYMAGFASLAIQNEVPEAKQWAIDISETITEWYGYAGSVLQNKPRNFDRNGGFYEGINYAAYGISQYLLFRLAFQHALPEEKQPDVPDLEKNGNFFIQTTYYREGQMPESVNFGDGPKRRNGNATMVLLWNLGYRNKDFAWYLKHTNHGSDKEAITLNTPNGLILNPDLPDLPSDYLPEQKQADLFADMGWATMRNSWENDATFVAVKSGLTWNHTHADANSFIVFHNGKNLIIDSGNSSYGKPLYTQYYCQSEAHNVVLFNGEGQDRRDPYFGVENRGSLHNLIDTKDFKYLLANGTGPYSHILKRNFRHFVWVGDVMLVIDDLWARKAGQFEWLLHFDGQSKRRGLDLSIKDGDAEVLVRPLFPETFPNGGLPHDFPEQMRLSERLGYGDHNTKEHKKYWSISQLKQTERTKFVSAITFKTKQNEKNLPVIERFEGKNFLGVRITQNGTTTELYLNLLADGRIKHRNSVIEMNGWETDAFLTALSFKTGSDYTKAENIESLFVGHGSYLRRKGQVLQHALSKYTSYVENFNGKQNVSFQGQPVTAFSIFAPSGKTKLRINGKTQNGVLDQKTKTVKIKIVSDEE